MSISKSYAVFGLGRYGRAVAKELIDNGAEVIAVDSNDKIVEELVGDIFDEMDEVVLDYKELAPNLYEVDGDMNIYDFFELVEYDDKDFESEYTTVGGWCTDMLEKFPEPGETFDFANITVTIKSVDKMRVEIATVEIHEKVNEEE